MDGYLYIRIVEFPEENLYVGSRLGNFPETAKFKLENCFCKWKFYKKEIEK